MKEVYITNYEMATLICLSTNLTDWDLGYNPSTGRYDVSLMVPFAEQLDYYHYVDRGWKKDTNVNGEHKSDY